MSVVLSLVGLLVSILAFLAMEIDDNCDIVRPYRLGEPGKCSPKKKVDFALALLKLRREKYEDAGLVVPSRLSFRAIAKAVGIKSPDTIMRWYHGNMSQEAILSRAKMRGHRKFTDDQELVLAGWVVYKELSNESSTTTKFHEFVGEYFDMKMSPSYVSKFMQRHDLSLKLPGNAKENEFEPDSLECAVTFLNELERLIEENGLTPSQVKVCASPARLNFIHSVVFR